jgi:3-hydroxyisobutyrate dehydrogenase
MVMKAGFIGLGAMGEPMARNLDKAGRLDSVWNRSRVKAEDLAAELGVAVADSPADLAQRADVVVICVSADRDVLQVIDALLPGVRPGTVVADCSTVSGLTAREAARRLAGRDADFLDAPVSGGVEGAQAATLAMMVGGEAAVLARVRPVLEAMASRIVHIGAVGMGQGCKAVNQIMAAGINQAVTEALAFGEAAGLPMDQVIEAVSGGAAGNWFLDRRGPTMTRGVFRPGFKLALHHKDLGICLESAEKLGVALPLAERARADYARLMEQGFGEEDISALYRLRRPRGSGH